MLDSPATFGIAGFCSFLAVTISFYQRYILRVIFMVPTYAVASWFSLKFRDSSIWFDTVRDCYEAWVIYNFLSLCFAYGGGPGAIVVKTEGKIVQPAWLYLTCCLPPTPVDGFFLRKCKQGALQFVILKPVLAALTLILYAADLYHDGVWTPEEGYLYIAIVYNIAYTVALYALILFLIGCESVLEPYHPLLKFILVKGVVFLTFWQGMGVAFFASKFPQEEDAKALQNFLICIEMLLASCMMLFAFPHADYKIGGSLVGFRWDATMHAISVRDLFSDTVHQFGNTYKDYVLYSDGGPGRDPKKKHGKGRGSTMAINKLGNSEHPRASLVKNMERGPTTSSDNPDEMINNMVKKSSHRKKKHSKPNLKRSSSGHIDRNDMQLVDSESDMSGEESDDMQIEMEGDEEAEGAGQVLQRVHSKRGRSRPPAPMPPAENGREPSPEPRTNGHNHTHSRSSTTLEMVTVDVDAKPQ